MVKSKSNLWDKKVYTLKSLKVEIINKSVFAIYTILSMPKAKIT